MQASAEVTALDCRVTCTRHDDWLHRGPFLADLPWQVYMMRVQRARKPFRGNAAYAELFFFDNHYALSALYCQQIRYAGQLAIPRLVGSVCPSQAEEDGEAHAAYKLMLFARTRCPGPGACADPLNFRALLMPSDKVDDEEFARQRRQNLKAHAEPQKDFNANRQKPRFGPAWKACRCELENITISSKTATAAAASSTSTSSTA